MGFKRSGRATVKIAMSLAVVASTTAVLSSCGRGPSEAEALVEHFTEALDHQDVSTAASLTSYPNAASASIQQIFNGLKADSVDYEISQFITLDDESGFFTLAADWNLGKDREWSYSVQGSVRKFAVGWRISWDPTVLMPELGHSRTAHMVRTDALAPRIVDSAGGVLMAEQPINAILLDPAKMPDPVATATAVSKAIEPVAPLITPESLLQDLVTAQGHSITAVSLRDPDFEILEPSLRAIPGVDVVKRPKLITADRRIVSPVLDALRNVWQSSRDATSGWAVQVADPNGAAPTQLTGYQGPPPPDTTATLDPKLQLAAEDAVVSVATPATIVAIQPSSGAVLAVAQNSQATDIGPIAFTGLYPAGSSLDIFKSAAAVEKGAAPQDVSAADTLRAAGRLGVGVDYKIPGLDAITGRLPDSNRGIQQIVKKQGTNTDAVMVSPFGMAVLAASIARGSAPTPMIAYGQPATTEADVSPLRADVADRLRTLMRAGVARPEFESLRSYSDVVGIPISSGADQWVIANKGDLAFAVYIEDADGTDQAAKMSARMLRAMTKPVA